MTNCTGGDADLGYIGGVAILATVSAATVALVRPGPVTTFALVPTALLFIIPLWPLGRIVTAWNATGRSACGTLFDLPYPPDGGEAVLAPIVISLLVTTIGLIVVALSRRLRKAA